MKGFRRSTREVAKLEPPTIEIVDLIATRVAEIVLQRMPTQPTPPKQLLTPMEIADEFNLEIASVRQMVRTGILQNLGSPAAMKIPRWSIEDWINANRPPKSFAHSLVKLPHAAD